MPDKRKGLSIVKQDIINYAKAGYGAIYITSTEEQRVISEVMSINGELNYTVYVWDAIIGIVSAKDGEQMGKVDPLECIAAIIELPERSMVILQDFHLFFSDPPNPMIVRALKNCVSNCKEHQKTIIVCACRMRLPPELEKEFVAMEFGLPDREMLMKILTELSEKNEWHNVPKGDDLEKIIDASVGMTVREAEDAFALSMVKSKTFDPVLIAKEKAQALKKSGILEVVETSDGINSIGGLSSLKDWLQKRKCAFTKKAKEFGLPTPKGMLILGPPGTGKSLTAKATAGILNRILYKADAGKWYGSLVGQSEGNIRAMIATAEAMAPCVLWIDEIEKGLSGSQSSGSTDGGTSARVLGTFLSWLQDKKSAVFVVATANDVSKLPPEVLRKGRFDELFFVDMPTADERESIWSIQIEKHGRKSADFNLPYLGLASEGLTGSEIEQSFIDAMYESFSSSKNLDTKLVTDCVKSIVPLSKMMGEKIKEIRDWAKGRCRMASKVEGETKKGRKVAT